MTSDFFHKPKLKIIECFSYGISKNELLKNVTDLYLKYKKIITRIYYVTTSLDIGESNEYICEFINQINNLCDIMKNHYVRIFNMTKKGFYVFIFQKRENPFTKIIVDFNNMNEKDEEMQQDIEISIDDFIHFALGNILSSFAKTKELFIAVYFFIGAFTVDQIFLKDIDQMRSYHSMVHKSNTNANNQFPFSTMLGMYICLDNNVGKKIGQFSSDKIRFSREVWICYELIEIMYDELESYCSNDFTVLDFVKKVLFHEFGHATFDIDCFYIDRIYGSENKRRILNEKRANFYASYIFHGRFDKEIMIITKFQPPEYHNPTLISQRYSNAKNYPSKLKEIFRKEGK